MFDSLLGLPAHPLYVHFAVGLVPLTALLTAWAAWLAPARRRVVALPLVALNLLTLVVAFVAKESGESLEHRLPREPLIEAHAQLGDILPVFPGLMLLASLAMWWLGRRTHATTHGVEEGARDGRGAHHGEGATAGHAFRRSGAETAVALLATLLALGTCFWTFRVGHSGAESVWHDTPTSSTQQQGEGD